MCWMDPLRWSLEWYALSTCVEATTDIEPRGGVVLLMTIEIVLKSAEFDNTCRLGSVNCGIRVSRLDLITFVPLEGVGI